MGWRHPHTNELLVSVKGLLDNKAEAVLTPQNPSTVSAPPSAGSAEVVVTAPTHAAPVDGATNEPSSDAVADASDKPADATDSETTEPGSDTSAADKPSAPAPIVDNTLYKFEQTGDTAVVRVTLRAPNHHAYTKWVVEGVDVDGVRGNTVDIKVGTAFTANNAKGSFSGQAIAAE